MTPLLLYLLKANTLLLLFAVAYFGLLRRLTFFGQHGTHAVEYELANCAGFVRCNSHEQHGNCRQAAVRAAGNGI